MTTVSPHPARTSRASAGAPRTQHALPTASREPRARARDPASLTRAARPRSCDLALSDRNFEEAINKYCKAAEYLLTALK